MTLTIGQPAPLFNVKTSKMKDWSLEAQRGAPLLLLFIPLAFTPT